MSFEKVPLIGSKHSDETRNIINLMAQIINDRGLEILSDSAFLTWLYENGIKHREEVATFADLPSDDSLNTVRGVVDDNKIYIKKENGWVPFQTIDINKINGVERTVEAISYVPPVHTFDNIADGINTFYQSLPDGAWMKIPAGEHYYNKTIIFDREINVDLTGAIMTYEGPTDQPALIIGKESEAIRHFEIKGTYIRRGFEDIYSNVDEVGIRVINVSYAKIDLSVFRFYTGVELTSGNGNGNVYNQYNLGWLYDNYRSLVLTIFNETGWTNENNFYGGGFQLTTGNVTENHEHIVIEEKFGYLNNNNRFYGPSLEARANCIALNISGNYNYFYGTRFEGTRRVFVGENSINNAIFSGFGSSSLTVEGNTGGINVFSDRHTSRIIDARGLKYTTSTTSGTLVEFFRPGGDSSIFSLKGNGDINSRNINMLNNLKSVYGSSLLFGISPESQQFTRGSLLLTGEANFSSLKTRIYGEPGTLNGVKDVQFVHSDTSAGTRPGGVSKGFSMFDTTLNKPIWWNGSVWVDSNGDTV